MSQFSVRKWPRNLSQFVFLLFLSIFPLFSPCLLDEPRKKRQKKLHFTLENSEAIGNLHLQGRLCTWLNVNNSGELKNVAVSKCSKCSKCLRRKKCIGAFFLLSISYSWTTEVGEKKKSLQLLAFFSLDIIKKTRVQQQECQPIRAHAFLHPPDEYI